MKTLPKKLLISVLALGMTISILSTAIAEEKKNPDCDAGATVKLGQMGTVNEESLLKHIEKMKLEMKKVRHGRGSHLSRTKALKDHLSEMQVAVQEIHDQKYADGCKDTRSDASDSTRIEVMEKRMDMMQQMMKQIVEHLSEKPE